ncbi:unnamed protein product [Cylicocyclus nassatus]|uniref:Uncharacterized protein n=1 Tax=Cylicocyclus nassatus TaxID=53992 RepID=A0AA36GUQ9_CYLNA|nr:unnamed protein product [Cylicocyclus nassatus]
MMEEASSSRDVIVIPPGKQLRFRCKFEGCLKKTSLSIVSVMDHVAAHFARQEGSDRIFNYYCRKCGVRFFLKGMCLRCKCNARGDGEQFISLKSGITLEDMKRETSFFAFAHKWIAPVLDDMPGAPPASSVGPQTSASLDEVVKEHGPVPIPQGRVRVASRTPLHYPQGVQYYDDEEKLQLPGNCPPLPQNRSGRSASNFVKEGNSVIRMNEDGENRAVKKWNSSVRKPHLFNNDLSRSEVLSNQPSAHPSTSNCEAQPQRPLQEIVVKVEEEQHSEPCSRAEVSSPDLAANITTFSSYAATAAHTNQASPSPPSAQNLPFLLDVHGNTINDHHRVLLPPPPPPPPLDAKESASQSKSEHSSTTAQCDKNAKKRSATTVRMLNKKSRQDGLREENPSSPRLSRRQSRSPRIHGSKTPTHEQVKSGPRTPDPHILSDSCISPQLENETTGYPAPSNAHHTTAYAPPVSLESNASSSALEIPLPASRTLGSGPSTSADIKEDEEDVYNGPRNVQESSGIVNAPDEEGEIDQTSNNRPDALPPPPSFPFPFFPPPFPPPLYPYMMPRQFPMPPHPFPIYNQFGLPLQSGMPYPEPLAQGTPPPGVPQPRPASAPSLGMPPIAYPHPYHLMYYRPS